MTGKLVLLLLACACADMVISHAHRPSSQPTRSELSQPPTEATSSVSVKETQGVASKSSESEGDEDGFKPETVLSVHYDRGLIKELYLSQTRGGLTQEKLWKPSVSERKRICTDLCEAGLGGDPCGYSCQAATPDMAEIYNQTQTNLNKLRTTLTTSSRAVKPYLPTGNNGISPIGRNIAKDVRGSGTPPSLLASVGNLVRAAIKRRESEESNEITTIGSVEEVEAAGVPRSEVCPTLCLNGLGNPLCSCDIAVQRPKWSSVCDVFCSADSSYHLAGCPVCQPSSNPSSEVTGNPQKLSDPSDFWLAWCKIEELMQLRQAEMRQKEVVSRRADYAWLSGRREEPARINGDQLLQIRALINKMTPEECASTAARASSILSGRGSHLEPGDIPTLMLDLLGCTQTCSLLSSCGKVPRGSRTVRFADQTVYTPPTLYLVKGMCILDNDGNRILARYYDKERFPTAKEQKAFEKNLFNKTHRANAEIIMLDGLTCVYRSNVDLFFYVMGSSHENELILMSVLNGLYESVSQILRRGVEKRAVLDSLDTVMLAVDEICDGGIILDADPISVVGRVALRTDDVPLGEQTVSQVIQSAREQLKWSLLK